MLACVDQSNKISKSHFLHPHAEKINQKLIKSFTFGLKKSKKIQKFHFSKNVSR